MEPEMTHMQTHTTPSPITAEDLLAYDDEQFIRAAYLSILGRSPDADGFSHYLNRVRSGVSKMEILSQIRLSDEAQGRAIFITGLDEAVKRRQRRRFPLAGAIARWFSSNTKGTSNSPAPSSETRSLGGEPLSPKPPLLGMDQVSISVVIPFYNGASFIERALRSVKNQTYPAREVIVVDDGSKPSESEACAKITKEFGYQYLWKENGGQGSARNFGVEHSTGDYICMLDQDDFYLPSHNSILASAVDDDPLFGFVYADLYQGDVDGNTVRTFIIKGQPHHPKTHLVECLKQDMFILPSASLIRKNAFLEVGGFDSRLTGYEDDDLFLRIFRKGYTNKYLDTAVTVWCQHGGSTSYSVKMARSRYIYLTKLIAAFPDDEALDMHYCRDLIVPRFLRLTIGETLARVILKNDHSDEYIDIFNNTVSTCQKYLGVEEAALLATLQAWLKLDRNILVDGLYFSRLGERYGFVQTFHAH
jgi:glycosyltransferase involved in cell wall biosynthesis